jgi:hypothetical protein
MISIKKKPLIILRGGRSEQEHKQKKKYDRDRDKKKIEKDIKDIKNE